MAAKGRKEENPFSSAFCNALLRFFWICYRNGIEDAVRSGDFGECEETIDRLFDARNFGTINYEMDWNEWQFKALQWTREDICRARVMDLVMSLRRPTHSLGFLMQIAKAYYVRGIKEWMECSDWLTLEMVKQMPHYPYLLKRAHSFRPSNKNERFETLQQVCFNVLCMFNSREEVDDYTVSRHRIVTFIERVWGALQTRRWFDAYDVEDDYWSEVNPTENVDLDEVISSDTYNQTNKGHDTGNKRRQRADRRVSRKDARRGDVSADGPIL